MPSKILHFSSDGDSLLRIIPLERSFTQFVKHNNSFFAFQGNYSQGGDKFNVCELTLDGKIVNSGYEILDGWESSISNEIHPFAQSAKGEILFIPPNTFNVYNLCKGFPSNSILKLDFGNANMPKDIDSFEKLRHTDSSNFISAIYDFVDTEISRIFYVIYQGQNILLINNKQTNENRCATLEWDNSKYFLPFGDIVSMDNKNIITSIDNSRMDYYLTGKNKYNDFSEEYAEQISNLNKKIGEIDTDGNPLLIFYSLK